MNIEVIRSVTKSDAFSYAILVVLLKLFNYLDRYIVDDEFKVIIRDNCINIVNYVELLDFSAKEISVKYDKGIMVIKGNELVVSKMMDDELLIIGNINNIRIN